MPSIFTRKFFISSIFIVLFCLVLQIDAEAQIPVKAKVIPGLNPILAYSLALLVPTIMALLHFRLPNYYLGLFQKINPLIQERFTLNSEIGSSQSVAFVLNILCIITFSIVFSGVQFGQFGYHKVILWPMSIAVLSFVALPLVIQTILEWTYASKKMRIIVRQNRLVQLHISLLISIPLFCLVLLMPTSPLLPVLSIVTFLAITLVWLLSYYKLLLNIYEWKALPTFNILYYLCVCEVLPILLFIVYFYRIKNG